MGNPLYRFSNLERFPNLIHGISPRSIERENCFNMSFEFQTPEHVLSNRDYFLNLAGGAGLKILSSYQTHSDHVYIHREGDTIPKEEVYDFDAFVTNAKGVALMIKIADCQPVFLYEPTKRVASLVHSGWRGSIKNVVGTTIRAMSEAFDVNPMKIIAAIGPSLGPCCSEFSNPNEELGNDFSAYFKPDHRVDFWAMTQDQLESEGVQTENIEIAKHCTACENDRWFSYRGDRRNGGFDVGRFGATLGMV